jgi:hypothetical protein
MKEMADVMLEHRITRTGRCSCGDVLLDMSPERVAAHVAAALTAAGFGRVADVAAGALDEAADGYRHYETPNARLYLRARAEKLRQA